MGGKLCKRNRVQSFDRSRRYGNNECVVCTSQQRSTHNPRQVVEPPIRISRESKGRKGKGVTLVTGLELNEAELKTLAKKLKALCGSGGTVKNRVIEVQGDHRDQIKQELDKQFKNVKLAGG